MYGLGLWLGLGLDLGLKLGPPGIHSVTLNPIPDPDPNREAYCPNWQMKKDGREARSP